MTVRFVEAENDLWKCCWWERVKVVMELWKEFFHQYVILISIPVNCNLSILCNDICIAQGKHDDI